jgi:hypothetical protein
MSNKTYYFYIMKMEAECSSETLIPTYKSKRCHNSEEHHLKAYCLRPSFILEAQCQTDRGANAAMGICQNARDCISARPWHAKCSQQPRE